MCFLTSSRSPAPVAIMSIAEKMFKRIDADGSGEISKDEMMAVFKLFDQDGKIQLYWVL